jgi:hypothetical protein
MVNKLKQCPTCGFLKEENPTPDGDEICPSCGDMEMLDFEGGATNEEYDKIESYLGKNKIDTYVYMGNFAPAYLKNQKVKIRSFFPNSGSTCEAFIQLYGSDGGQTEWIPREEIINNLIKLN